MVLVDTSVWIRHLRQSNRILAAYLIEGQILHHPFVSGELACGNLENRSAFLQNLQALPSARVATNPEVFQLIEDRKLWGTGLGWVDVHLLASALLSNCGFWTEDKRLAAAAADLGLDS